MIRCPKCGEELSTVKCLSCGSMTLEMGTYCMFCGAKIDRSSDLESEEDIDFENRVLCSDGTCTGIVVNGRCTECGKPQ